MYAVPESYEDIQTLIHFAEKQNVQWVVLGSGANILVSDKGIKGIVINTENINTITVTGETLIAEAGVTTEAAVTHALHNGLVGLEFLSGMPGSIGGAVWMNARCYGQEISGIIHKATILTRDLEIRSIKTRKEDFDYKISPFQKEAAIILNAEFTLKKGEILSAKKRGADYKQDRERKGHYRLPSAGSVFMNDRTIGKPSGQIIDECGLKGMSIGGAKIADWHGNIIVNTGDAKARDIFALIVEARNKVLAETGYYLQPEIRFIGEWEGLNEFKL